MGLLRRLFGRGEPVEVALARARALVAAGDAAGAVAIWAPLARKGHARARNALGACYAEGRGIARDLALAHQWIGLAAKSGDRVAQRNLAALVFRGEGSDPDDREAARLYRIAAENGDAPAQDMLSWMLLEGVGVATDPEAARHWAEARGGGRRRLRDAAARHDPWDRAGHTPRCREGCDVLAARGRPRRRRGAGAAPATR